jgi:prophage regulatory protein
VAQTRIIRLKEVKRRVGLSRSSIYAFLKENRFPRSIQLGARAVGWLESEIDKWIEDRLSGGGSQ